MLNEVMAAAASNRQQAANDGQTTGICEHARFLDAISWLSGQRNGGAYARTDGESLGSIGRIVRTIEKIATIDTV